MPLAAPRNVPLRVRDRVALIVDALAPLPATVAAADRAQATLLLDDGPIPARMLHRRAAAIETAVDGRRYRADGVVAMVAGRRGKAREDAVAFHFGAAEPAAAVPPAGLAGEGAALAAGAYAAAAPTLRRREDRAPAILPVTLVPVHSDLPPARGLTLNVSPGGALLRGPSALESGQELLLHLHLPNEDLPVPAKGEVVRRAGDGLLGVRLDRMRDADRGLVLAWLARQPVA